MKTSAQYNAETPPAILLVGEPGAGKSRILMGSDKPGILDCDMNLQSAIRVTPNVEFKYSQPAFDDNDQELPDEERWMRAVNETKALIRDPDVNTICIDGLGILCHWLTKHVTHQNSLAGVGKKKTIDLSGKRVQGMELQMYGEVGRLIRDYVTMLRTSRKMVIVTSHQTADRDELTGVVRYSLAIPGQTKDTLGGLFTDVWAAVAQNVAGNIKYRIATKPTGFHVALKTSFPLEQQVDVTGKTPEEIWAMLKPKMK